MKKASPRCVRPCLFCNAARCDKLRSSAVKPPVPPWQAGMGWLTCFRSGRLDLQQLSKFDGGRDLDTPGTAGVLRGAGRRRGVTCGERSALAAVAGVGGLGATLGGVPVSLSGPGGLKVLGHRLAFDIPGCKRGSWAMWGWGGEGRSIGSAQRAHVAVADGSGTGGLALLGAAYLTYLFAVTVRVSQGPCPSSSHPAGGRGG